MKASIIKIDITPKHPVHMAGYNRLKKSTGVLDTIQINTLMIEINETKYVYSYLDSIMITNEFTQSIRKQIYTQLNIPNENINIGCIHTHSAPAFFKLQFENTIVEEELTQDAQDKIIQSILMANENLQECTLSYGKTMINGLYGNRNRIDGPSDKTASLLQLTNLDGKVFGQCLNISVHPTILDGSNYQLSGDLLGWIRNKVEADTSIPTLIFNGTTGDVSTRFFRALEKENELKDISQEIAQAFLSIQTEKIDIENSKYSLIGYITHSDFRLDEVNKNFINKTNMSVQEHYLKDRALLKESWGAFDLYLESTICVLGKLIIICLPGDVVSSFGLQIRETFKDYHVMISCYSNAYTNYIVNKEEYGKYFETIISRCHYGEADKFIDQVINRTKELIKVA